MFCPRSRLPLRLTCTTIVLCSIVICFCTSMLAPSNSDSCHCPYISVLRNHFRSIPLAAARNGYKFHLVQRYGFKTERLSCHHLSTFMRFISRTYVNTKPMSFVLHKEGCVHGLSMSVSMGWDDGCELRPLTCSLFIPQVIYEYGRPRWNDIDRLKPKNSEKNLSQYHFVHH
jgi:hypothetical protein